MLGNVEISYFGDPLMVKDVSGLDVSVDDVGVMQLPESLQGVVG